MLTFVADPPNHRHQQLLALIVASGIFILWAIGFLVNIIDREYEPPGILSILMPAVCAFLFGASALGKRNGRD